MTKSTKNAGGLTPTNVALLAQPLEYIAQDHLRIRAMCSEIDQVVVAGSIPDAQRSEIHAFLTTELPDLLWDENDHLFPMVLARAKPEDELLRLRQRLQSEHLKAQEQLSEIIQYFDPNEPQQISADTMKERVLGFTSHLRRHLILKNAILMPLARLRLTKDDLEKLADTMSRKRQTRTY